MRRLLEGLYRLYWIARNALEPVWLKLPWLGGLLLRLAKQLAGLLRFLVAVVHTFGTILKGPAMLLHVVLIKNKLASGVIALCVVLIAVLLIRFEGGNQPVVDPLPEDRPDYFIGAILSLTGNHQRQGNDMRRGYETAIRAYNETGGLRIDAIRHNLALVIYDDESSPVRAGEVAQLMFASDDPQVLLGPYSSALSRLVVGIAGENEVPVVLPIASAAGVASDNDAFLIQTPPAVHLVDAARIFIGQVRNKKGLLLRDDERFANGAVPRVVLSAAADAHSQSVIKGVRDEIGKIAEVEIADLDLGMPDEEYAEAIAVLEKVDAMFVSSYADGASRLMGTVATEGFNIPFLALTHCEVANIPRHEPTAAEGALCALHWQAGAKFSGSAPLASNDFENKYYEEYGSRPSHHAAAAAAAIQVIVSALRASETSEATLEEAIAATNIDTFYGPIKFGAGGQNVAKPMVISQVTQSRYVPVAPPHLAARQPNPTRPILATSK